MRSLDVHTHVLPPELPRWSPIRLERTGECRARMLREDGSLFREIESNAWDPEQRLRECDAAGVGAQALSTVPVLFAYPLAPGKGHDLSRLLNDHIAALCAQHPRRFVGLGTLPMQAPDLAVRELERCLDLGLAGVQIGSHVNEWNLSDPPLFPVFARAAELAAAAHRLRARRWRLPRDVGADRAWLPCPSGSGRDRQSASAFGVSAAHLRRLARPRPPGAAAGPGGVRPRAGGAGQRLSVSARRGAARRADRFARPPGGDARPAA